MTSTFTAVDLSRLPFPDVVEALDFETLFAQILADFRQRAPEYSALVESDPVIKALEAGAYAVLQVRQRFNDGARAVMLALSSGADLDQLAANYNLERLVIDAGNPAAVPPVPPTLEPDADLKRRVQLAYESLSTAGPEGAYIAHALGADPQVLDASVTSPAPVQVVVTVLSRQGNGVPSGALLAAVLAALDGVKVRPLTDQVVVQAATIVNYQVDAELTLFPGPDGAVVLEEAEARLEAYVESCHRLGRDVTRSGLFAALHVDGVQNVELTLPAADVVVTDTQASYCTARSVTVAGTAE